VTLEPIYCLGLCATAPSAMLDGRVVGRLDETRIDALIAEAQRRACAFMFRAMPVRSRSAPMK
jgi:hypothetical protein